MAKVVTVGGSVGGMAAALLLARRGHQVTVLERDADHTPTDPEDAFARWERRSVPHLRGTHMFSSRGVRILAEHAPDVLDQLERAGAHQREVSPDVTLLQCRRTTFEMVVRRAALEQPGVRFRPGTEVAELVADRTSGPVPHVTAVGTLDGEQLRADLVVDAGGRRSLLPLWLRGIGATPPETETMNSHMAVHTRWYQLRDTDPMAPPPQIVVDLGYSSAILAPADSGTFSVTFGVFGRDPLLAPLRQPAGFVAAARAVPALARWVDPDVSAALENRVRVLGNLLNRVVRLVSEGEPVTTGVVALGDSAVCTNPRFGRGISLALLQAASLVELLEEHEEPYRLALAFARSTAEQLEPWYRTPSPEITCAPP